LASLRMVAKASVSILCWPEMSEIPGWLGQGDIHSKWSSLGGFFVPESLRLPFSTQRHLGSWGRPT